MIDSTGNESPTHFQQLDVYVRSPDATNRDELLAGVDPNLTTLAAQQSYDIHRECAAFGTAKAPGPSASPSKTRLVASFGADKCRASRTALLSYPTRPHPLLSAWADLAGPIATDPTAAVNSDGGQVVFPS
jgi:hypothetical protein